MTAQEAAHQILTEIGHPLSLNEIAQLALDRGLVSSTARDPVHSIATTIAKNIRDGIYNLPELISIGRGHDRKVALPRVSNQTTSDEAHERTEEPERRTEKMTLEVPTDLAEQIRLAHQAKLGDSLNSTVVALIQSGLSEYASTIRNRLLEQLEKISSRSS